MGKVMKAIVVLVVLGAVGALGGWMILIHPANPLTLLFRAKLTETDSKVVLGPYPLEDDFSVLKRNGVTTIVSLLDPRIPYEAVLLDRERELAERYSLKLLNFPMASILGQALDDDREQRIAKAADAIAQEQGKVFLHCYLGIHRAKAVEEAVRQRGVTADKYLVRRGERDTETLLLDEAQAHYDATRYREAAVVLAQLQDPPIRALLLRGWSLYRLDDRPEARKQFAAVLARDPVLLDAHVGLGYVALRDNALGAAEREFQIALSAQADHADALVGLAIVEERRGKPAQAATHLRSVLAVAPQHEEARTMLAKLEQR
jgi:tetratricopeptide (TPR) repeat protein